jgi:hypothetical protein
MRRLLRLWLPAVLFGLTAALASAADRDPRLDAALDRAEAGDSAGAEAEAQAVLTAAASP